MSETAGRYAGQIAGAFMPAPTSAPKPSLPPPPSSAQVNMVVEAGTWPADKVADILRWAGRLAVEGVKEAIDMIRDCLGHPEIAMEHANFWVDVETALKDAQTSVAQEAIDMSGLWEGIAYESFMRWEGTLEQALTGTGGAAVEMKDVALGMVNYITDVYNALLDFIVDTHAALMRAVGGLLDSLADTPVPTDVLVVLGREACFFLAEFETNAKDFIIKASNALQGYREEAVQVASARADIKPAPAYPEQAERPKWWNPADAG